MEGGAALGSGPCPAPKPEATLTAASACAPGSHDLLPGFPAGELGMHDKAE